MTGDHFEWPRIGRTMVIVGQHGRRGMIAQHPRQESRRWWVVRERARRRGHDLFFLAFRAPPAPRSVFLCSATMKACLCFDDPARLAVKIGRYCCLLVGSNNEVPVALTAVLCRVDALSSPGTSRSAGVYYQIETPV